MHAANPVASKPVVWHAKWIAAPGMKEQTAVMPLFRRAFVVKKKLAQATLLVSAMGQGEVHLNGVKVSDDELAPAWTDYRKTVRYESYDVATLLREGENILGVMVGNGMFNVVHTPHRFTKFEGSFGVPEVLLQLELRYADGSNERIASDGSWESAPGPIVFSSIYGGEDYDARSEVAGWDVAMGFRKADWAPVAVVAGPSGKLMPEVAPPIRVMKTYTVANKTEPKQGAVVYDLGQNIAGWPEIAVRGAKGAVVKMTPGDLLNADGTVSQRSSGSPQWFSYTLKGQGEERWHPRFSYYGFRWVQVQISGGASVINLEGHAVHSTSKAAGAFESSEPILNAIHKLIVEAMHNNEVSIFTDCPHREKLGWLEQDHLVAQGLMYNNDLRGLCAATAQNMVDAQHADGDVPTTAPEYTVFGPKYAMFDDSPEWGSAMVLAPWAAYQFYGDKHLLAEAYPAMQRYVAFLESKANDGIVSYGLGDWFDIGPGAPGVSKLTSAGVTGTLMLYEDAAAMQRIATLLGKPSDAAKYSALAKREKAAFQARFFDSRAQVYDKGSQAAQAMPLALGIVPEEARTAVLAKLVADIHAHDDHVTTGEVGWAYLVRALIQNNRSDVLLAMLLRKDAPSYGSQLAAGATTLTEAWDAKTGSQDHFMLGAGEEWFYRGLLGINVDMSRASVEQLRIEPQMADGLQWVRGSYDSSLGLISSEWRHDGSTVIFEITTPKSALVRIPLRAEDSVSIAGGERGVTRLRAESGAMLYRVTAGAHRFTVISK
jgi:alpha-L-rhamnosidase